MLYIARVDALICGDNLIALFNQAARLRNPYMKVKISFTSVSSKSRYNRKFLMFMNHRKQSSKLLCGVLALAILPLATMPKLHAQDTTQNAAPQNKQVSIDRPRLEIIEDLSESLANDLLELSVAVHERDATKTAAFFPLSFDATPFPCKPLAVKPEVKWVGMRGWTIDDAARKPTTAQNISIRGERRSGLNANTLNDDVKPIVLSVGTVLMPTRRQTKKEFLTEWERFLDHFADIEDVRFKVKEAQFDDAAQSIPNAEIPTAQIGAKGKARVAFYVIGRNTEGKREWTRGVANVTARYDKTKRWQFDSFVLADFNSMVASEDMFSEVAVPANVAASVPAYGQPGNGGFIYNGAAATDFNQDGWMDLFVTAPDRNYLYLNDGKGKFKDISEEVGVKFAATGVAPLAFDYDNDGDADVFISAVGGSQILLQNRLVEDKNLGFIDVSNEAGVALPAIGFSAVAGDVNGDGFLDVYVCGYNRYGQVTPDSWFRATNGTPNLLFINHGDGTFKEQAKKWGVDDSRWSYSAAFADVNGDGKQDLYVANDFGEKAMFINRGNKFVDEAKTRGVLDPGNGMGVSFGDYNNDGLLDLHASNMSSTAGNRILARLFPKDNAKDNVLKKLAAGNNLFENQGDGKFKDVTADVGGFSGGWSWGGGFIDFDNDGWEDIFTPNGFISGKSMKDT